MTGPATCGPGGVIPTATDAKPVDVVVYRQAKSYVVYVLSSADCSVVSRVTVP